LLKATGNFPGFVGSCETIVEEVPSLSNGSSSISPRSSVSEAEVWGMQKELLDLKSEIVRLKKLSRLDRINLLEREGTVAFSTDGFSDGLMEDINRVCPNGYTQDYNGEDPDTVYFKKSV